MTQHSGNLIEVIAL